MIEKKKYNRVKGLNDYSKIHWWLRYNYGKADRCENPSCYGWSKKYEWAKLAHKNYEKNRENFIKLCAQCHRNYDVSFHQNTPLEIKRNKGYARSKWQTSNPLNNSMQGQSHDLIKGDTRC